jgi:tetratricopeptide (TPR) repeat protein
MVGRLIRRQLWIVAVAVGVLALLPWQADAQGTNGMAQGVVKDAKGAPVDGATITFTNAESARKIETKSNRRGEFQQVGLAPGNYVLSAAKGDLVAVPASVRISADQTLRTEIVLVDKKTAAAAAAGTSAADAKMAEFKAAFDAGVAAAGAGRHDEAIEKFTAAAAANDTCADCYTNIGNAYLQKKDYDNAIKALEKSNQIKPNAPAYTGLASVYTAQKKLDQAATAMAKATELSSAAGGAAGGGNADALYNQGVTLWNAGKIEDAKKQFEAAVAADPNHADAHYQLGMALVNEGNLAGAKTEWEMYLKLAPQGAHAAEVNAMLPSLK